MYLVKHGRQLLGELFPQLRVVREHRVGAEDLVGEFRVGRHRLHHGLHVRRGQHVLHQLGVGRHLGHQARHARAVEHACNIKQITTVRRNGRSDRVWLCLVYTG